MVAFGAVSPANSLGTVFLWCFWIATWAYSPCAVRLIGVAIDNLIAAVEISENLLAGQHYRICFLARLRLAFTTDCGTGADRQKIPDDFAVS